MLRGTHVNIKTTTDQKSEPKKLDTMECTSNDMSSVFANTETPEDGSDVPTKQGSLKWRPIEHSKTLGGPAQNPSDAIVDAGSGMTFDEVSAIAARNNLHSTNTLSEYYAQQKVAAMMAERGYTQ